MANDGCVRLDDIAKSFDPNANPDVTTGGKSDQEVFMEFMNLWDTQVKDGVISMEEFCAYHEDISAFIDTDEQFEVYVKGAYKME